MHAAATRELPKVDKGDYGAIIRSIEAAIRYRPSEVRIELDGDRTIETKALLVAVANGPFMGPGLTVAPDASLDDGLFDVRVFLHYTKAELTRYLTSIAFGRRADERRSLTERASWVRITSPRPLPARADAAGPGNHAGRVRDPTEGPPGGGSGPDQRHRAGRDCSGSASPSPAAASGRPLRRSRETPADAATRNSSHSAPAR